MKKLNKNYYSAILIVLSFAVLFSVGSYNEATIADAPVQMQVRVQLRKNNANFSEPSDIKLMTVNP